MICLVVCGCFCGGQQLTHSVSCLTQKKEDFCGNGTNGMVGESDFGGG